MSFKVTKEMAEFMSALLGLNGKVESVGYDEAARAQLWVCSIHDPDDEFSEPGVCAECDRTIFFDPRVKSNAKKICVRCATDGRFDF